MEGSAYGHVRWLGGSTGAGKTVVATHLSATYGLCTYSTDDAIGIHSVNPGPDSPLLAKFLGMGMDERWLERSATTMLATFPWFGGERFARIVTDLDSASTIPLKLAEGFRLLPRLVKPLLASPRHGLWLTTTPDFRRATFEQRPESAQFWRRTSDPAAALEQVLERDALFDLRLAKEMQELGLKLIVVDGTQSIGAVTAEAAAWFGLIRN